MRVLVTGANGFIGTHAVRQLLDEGHAVRGLVWPSDADANSRLLREWGCDVVLGDFEDAADAERVLADMDGVVHLIGSIKRPEVGTFEQMHRAKTEGLVAAAKRAGVRRIVYISAPGASATAKSDYLRTKFQAEEAIRASGLEWVVLRCSLVVGRRWGERDSKLMRRLFDMARTKRKMPVLGSGENRLQPVHVQNLAEIIAQALLKPEAAGRVVGVGGPETLTMNQLVAGILKAAGCPKKPVKHIPMPVVHILARVLPLVMADPPIEKAQVQAMQETVAVDVDAMLRLFPVELVRFGEAVGEYR
jgi:NADH dehydrogenase